MPDNNITINITPNQQAWLDNVNEAEKVAPQGQTTTDIGKTQSNAKSLVQSNYDSKTVSILQNTYFFNETEAHQVAAFAKAVNAIDPKIQANVNPGFLTKIKSLCAKILKFFGNESKAVQLQNEGIEAFKNLRSTLLHPENKEFALKFIENQKSDTYDTVAELDRKQDVLEGFAKVLGFKDGEVTPEQLEAFVEVTHFKQLKNPNERIASLKEIIKRHMDPSLSSEDMNKSLKALEEEFSKLLTPDASKDIRFACEEILAAKMEGPAKVFKELEELDLMNRLQEKMPDNGPKLENSADMLKWFKDNKQCNCLMDKQLLEDFQDIKTFLEKEVLPISKEALLEGLKQSLEEPQVLGNFSKENPIFKDLNRNFTLKIYVDNREVGEIDKEKDATAPVFDQFNKIIGNLSKDDQKKLQDFCKNFPAQGVFSLQHPNVAAPGYVNGDKTSFAVNVSEKGIHVEVSTRGEREGGFPGFLKGFIAAKIRTPVCKFEFDFNPEDGSSSNINVVEYSGQTVNIDLQVSQ